LRSRRGKPAGDHALLAGASVFALAALGGSGVGVARSRVDGQHVLHRGHERAVGLGRDDPALSTMGLESVFFKTSNGGAIPVTGGGSIGGGAEGVFAENCSITTLSNRSCY
jgi:hypothetical protein